MHRVYHEDLKNHIPIKPDFREGYSCLHHGCNEIFFDYHELRRHKQQQHPMVELKCRLCDRKGVHIEIREIFTSWDSQPPKMEIVLGI